jgi:hypothetical protein
VREKLSNIALLPLLRVVVVAHYPIWDAAAMLWIVILLLVANLVNRGRLVMLLL